MIYLDTSFLVDYLRESARKQPGAASAFFETIQDEEEPTISVFVLCELFTGVHLYTKPNAEGERVRELCNYLNVDYPGEQFPAVYGHLLARLTRNGHTISTMDLLIGAAAVASDAPLVTRNVKDFAKIPGLKVMSY